jgi:hypothetical protein
MLHKALLERIGSFGGQMHAGRAEADDEMDRKVMRVCR